MTENKLNVELQKYYPENVSGLPEWHPVKKYYAENFYLNKVIEDLQAQNLTDDFPKVFNLFNQLAEVEKRYVRKENQLFPYLEKHGWFGPSQGMWSFQDSNRELIKKVRRYLDLEELKAASEGLDELIFEVKRMMIIEEMRLFPGALSLLSEQDWKEMSAGDEEVGWIFKQMSQHKFAEEEHKEFISDNLFLKMNEGRMSLDQINLLFKIIPVDLTFVDENDRVIFYNRGESRVFPRSAGIIGREVRFCHPPKSVATVLRILEEFKNGTKDQAEFWIDFKGRKIHIRYFAVRDESLKYRGVIEMSQDITEIQMLQGERRLLNWE